MVLTAWTPALFVHIGHIIGMRANKEVGRIAANHIIAVVTDHHPDRDWSVPMSIKQTMDQPYFGCPARPD
jgi:hypothetical protein